MHLKIIDTFSGKLLCIATAYFNGIIKLNITQKNINTNCELRSLSIFTKDRSNLMNAI